ncbi:hypothetical protein AKJ65_05680 [candidate division MSBL1 archaeon SCGC-AAA259E19]|uniref:site-specific DNA-methyltransferase (adenine-specific) n=1 Tax=candidate division MSBL1 archaeon SCGC-AAA259E19 TaxID=1698264 RepID=A0A133UIX0_9EURY|nr:hypothetical protein AKJ65_05680 [candidate division MSBL1 archaeon SCGC-AAA259E19]
MKKKSEYFQGLDEFENFLEEIINESISPDRKECYNKLKSNPEILTEIFVSLKTQEERKKEGQFITPKEIANFMVNWTMKNKRKDVFLDPGSGTGVFTEVLLKEGAEKVIAVDKDPLCIKMTKVRAKLIGKSEKLETFNQDFITEFSSNSKIEGIVCNPPYVRHHEFEKEYKNQLNYFAIESTDLSFDKLSGLHVYFFIKATRLLDEKGRMAFITSSEFLDSRYGTPLKKFLHDKFNIESLILFDEAFEEVLTTSCISLLSKNGGKQDVKMIDGGKFNENVLKEIEGEELE